MLLLIFAGCSKTGRITKTSTHQYAVDKSLQADSASYQMINPYRNNMKNKMDEVIGYSEITMVKGQPESTLGNFAADAAFSEAGKFCPLPDNKKPDFAFLNNGGLRASLPEGALTLGNIYQLMPFENELVIITLRGSSVSTLIQYIIDKGGVPVSNIIIKVADRKASEVKINGADFDSTKTYKIVTSDYLANGGDNLKLMNEAVNKEMCGLKVRDAMITYIKMNAVAGKKITSQKEGRIVYEQ